ncbi:MAG: energy transducer TonB, partial [Pedobacter sp.]
TGWLDVVFKNRNKLYGAYALRAQSDAVLARSLFIAVFLFTSFFAGALIYKRLNPEIHVVEVSITPMELISVNQDKKKPIVVRPKSSLLKQPKVKMIKYTNNLQVVNRPVEVELPKLTDLTDVAIGTVTQDGDPTNGNPIIQQPAVSGNGTGAQELPGNTVYDYASIQSYPEFEGGMKGWAKYMQRNLRYPATAQDNGIQGKVYLTFVVEVDGSITDVTLLKAIGGGCDEEAIRVVSRSPKWKAGMQNNQKVRVRYQMPIQFSLM